MKLINMRPSLTFFIFLFILFCNIRSKAQFILAGRHDCSHVYTSYTPYLDIYPLYGSPLPYNLDLNGDSIKDFKLYHYQHYGGNYSDIYCYIEPIGQNEVAFDYADSLVVSNNISTYTSSATKDIPKIFSINDSINSNLIWKNNSMYFYYWNKSPVDYYTYLKSGGVPVSSTNPALIGLRILTATDTLYGWVNLLAARGSTLRIKDMACDAIYPMPQPLISQNGNILSSNFSSGNQWYRNGTLLVGANDHTYTLTQNGNYSLVVDYHCTSDTADLVINNVSATDLTIIRPNPTSDKIWVPLNSSTINSIWELYNSAGQLILKNRFDETTNIIDLQGLSHGLYFLKIGLNTQKIILE